MSEVTDVAIVGAGGFAREALWVFEESNAESHRWNVLGYVDNDSELQDAEICGVPVLGNDDWIKEHLPHSVKLLSAIGSPRARKAVASKMSGWGFRFCSVVHPSARMSRFVEIGEGTIVTAGNIITTQIRLGNHVLMNLDCTVGHDSVINDYCVVSPGAHISGNVTLGEGVELGTGACVIPGKRIGDWSIIGAGSVVVKDIPSHVTAVGLPCRVIKSHNE